MPAGPPVPEAHCPRQPVFLGALAACYYRTCTASGSQHLVCLSCSCLQEVHAIAAVPRHPNVVGYYAAWIEQAERGEMLYMQLERCGCSLSSIMTIVQEWKEQELVEMLRQASCSGCTCLGPLVALAWSEMFWWALLAGFTRTRCRV